MATNKDAIDANHVSVIMGKGDNGESLPIKIDHVTGRVLAEIYYVASDSNLSQTTRALHDANHAPTTTGLSDDGNKTKISLPVNSSTGYLMVDMVTE